MLLVKNFWFLPNQAQTLSIWPTIEFVILTKFHENYSKIVDFLLIAHFLASLISSDHSLYLILKNYHARNSFVRGLWNGISITNFANLIPKKFIESTLNVCEWLRPLDLFIRFLGLHNWPITFELVFLCFWTFKVGGSTGRVTVSLTVHHFL